MAKTLEFPALLRLIDERATAFRAAILSAPSLDLPVPTCPDWTLLDLVEHLGKGQRKWTAVVHAGPAATPPAEFAPDGLDPAPREREALLTWWDDSTARLLNALREAGPDRGCWTWWGGSESPQTAGAVARHRVQEVAVHTYDAQITQDAPHPLPEDVALDGVDEFLTTCCATTIAWPHKPADLDFHAIEGHSWRLSLDAEGARTTRLPSATAAGEGPDAPTASARATASDVVLWLYNRIPLDSLRLHGDGRVFDLLRDWNPDE
ncbi:maleylpyruvate isomerase N-terminal domain-containing protein [Micromonospora sp. NBC_01699]|uniref:maleylpyruvate isomerase family mycothiol-dependent enzyme n=1 Tax=Micromonospora sp. NBC_01699 TaxID=2975984 RepID=UPI002E30F076|nr:maleylpyruvate isomerase family mycothiol-dependent enzyme [Micromonospora sp. NBC_01699]